MAQFVVIFPITFTRIDIKQEPAETSNSITEVENAETSVKSEIKQEDVGCEYVDVTYEEDTDTTAPFQVDEDLKEIEEVVIKECSVNLVRMCNTQMRKYLKKSGKPYSHIGNQQFKSKDGRIQKRCKCELCTKGRRKNPNSGKKHYTCKECGKKFTQISSLKRHAVSAHSEVRPYQCNICEKSFARKEYLQLHLVTHGGPKDFKCDKCERTFARKEYLRTHIRTHTGEKIYKCDTCEQTFARSCNLKVHMWSKHNDKKFFACDICGKGFTRRDNLQLHLWTHSSDKPFRCDVCGKTFARQHILDTHLKVHSKVLDPEMVKIEDNSCT